MGNCIGKHNDLPSKMVARNPNEINLSNKHIGERALLKPSYCLTSHNKSNELPFVIYFDKETKEKYILACCELCLSQLPGMSGGNFISIIV
mmetsp:Transcript_2043/g.3437  ORF Transcript_2043/g.3437 Transcript_2043/m.3437 type:complete len:91 (-) Transcript_2043:625-897(-)